ncbi:MAG: hypothetical protein JWM64_2486 [Frankiales bacterium]|nr:hypothetical protein [Frankiales bacterium]
MQQEAAVPPGRWQEPAAQEQAAQGGLRHRADAVGDLLEHRPDERAPRGVPGLELLAQALRRGATTLDARCDERSDVVGARQGAGCVHDGSTHRRDGQPLQADRRREPVRAVDHEGAPALRLGLVRDEDVHRLGSGEAQPVQRQGGLPGQLCPRSGVQQGAEQQLRPRGAARRRQVDGRVQPLPGPTGTQPVPQRGPREVPQRLLPRDEALLGTEEGVEVHGPSPPRTATAREPQRASCGRAGPWGRGGPATPVLGGDPGGRPVVLTTPEPPGSRRRVRGAAPSAGRRRGGSRGRPAARSPRSAVRWRASRRARRRRRTSRGRCR